MILFPIDPEEFTSSKLNCNSWVATAIIGSAALGALTKTYTASQAVGSQQAAGGKAVGLMTEGALKGAENSNLFYDKAIGQLAPYQAIGTEAWNNLQEKLPVLTNPLTVPNAPNLPVAPGAPTLSGLPKEMAELAGPIQFTQEELEKLPGYEFTKKQGLKAVQNSAAARGLGVSGAALKGAGTFATELANSKWSDYFGQQMANRQGAFGRYGDIFTKKLGLELSDYENLIKEFQNKMGVAQTGFGNEMTRFGAQSQTNQSAFERLKSLIDTGSGAAGLGAGAAVKTGSDISKGYVDAAKGAAGVATGVGNAEAAGINATGDAWSKAFSDIGGYMAYKGLYGGAGQPTFGTGVAGNYSYPTFPK